MSKKLQICHHPELRPTDWNQPKPQPTEMISTCECGENSHCPVCGWGYAIYPCKCMREKGIGVYNADNPFP